MRAPASSTTGEGSGPHGQASLLAGSPSRAGEPSAVEAGAEIGAALWADRTFGQNLKRDEATHNALAWVRGARGVKRAAWRDVTSPGELLASLAYPTSTPHTVAGILEGTLRDLRFALAYLDGATIKNTARGYEPKDGDVVAVLLDVERRLEVAERAVFLEADAVALALHAAALGAVPEATRHPGDYREDVPPGVLERVGRALEVDGCDVAAAQAVARVWGMGELGEGEARKLLAGLVRLREALDDDAQGEPPPEDEDDGGGAAPAAREGKPRPQRGEPEAGGAGSAPEWWGGWRVTPIRRGAGAS